MSEQRVMNAYFLALLIVTVGLLWATRYQAKTESATPVTEQHLTIVPYNCPAEPEPDPDPPVDVPGALKV